MKSRGAETQQVKMLCLTDPEPDCTINTNFKMFGQLAFSHQATFKDTNLPQFSKLALIFTL